MGFFKNKWSKWTDVSVGSCCGIKYVLQVRRHRDGRIKMRCEKLMGAYDTVAHPSMEQLKQIQVPEFKTDGI